MTEISIVIPSVGIKKNLDQILKSIEAQKNVTFQVIVVLNGLSHDERKIYYIWQKTLSENVVFHYLDSKGVNFARNYGLKAAEAEIVLFLDDDCVLPNENFLNTHLRFHKNYQEVVAFGGGYQLPTQFKFIDKIYNQRQMHWLYQGLQTDGNNYHLLGGNFSVKKNKLSERGIGFDNQIVYGGSEFDFFKKIKNYDLFARYIDLPVVHVTSENIFSLGKKMYKQGGGKAIIDSRYSKVEVLENNLIETEMSFREKICHHFLNFVFWAGYYNKKGSCFGIIKHIIRNLISYANYKRFVILQWLENSFSKKKNDGDRF